MVPPNRRLRLAVALAAGITSLLCLGGVGVIVVLYDEQTKINRSSPAVSALEYLIAVFVQRDPARASLWTCEGAQLAGAQHLLDEITRREDALDTTFIINVENNVVSSTSATSAQVRSEIRRSAKIDGIRQSTFDAVQLVLEDRDGWRVCAVTRVP